MDGEAEPMPSPVECLHELTGTDHPVSVCQEIRVTMGLTLNGGIMDYSVL